MPVIDADAILKQISEGRERLRALGVTEAKEHLYYEQLSGPDEFRDEDQDNRAFSRAIDGLGLSDDDRAFVKTVLDSGDGR